MSSARWASCFLASLLLSACTRPTLQIVGESTKLRRGDPFPRHSALYDGHVVRLRAARGEPLGVQVLGGKGRLELPSAAAQVDTFTIEFLRVREPSTSMYGESRGAGEYPDRLVASAVGDYFDVLTRADAPAGLHHGRLEFAGRSIPVELRIEPVAIDVAKDPLVWVFYLPEEIARAHGVPDDDGPAELLLERRYVDLFRAHGAELASDLPLARFAPRRSFAEKVRYYPVALDTSSDERLRRDVAGWLAAFAGLSATPFAIPIDEPHGDEARRRVRHIGEQIAAAGGGRPKLLRAVTDVASPIYGDAVDVYISGLNIPSGPRPFWTYNGATPGSGAMILDSDGVALRTWGWIAYRYGIELWYAWEGTYFRDRYNGGRIHDVVHDPLTFDQRPRDSDLGNGDGLLVYPGPEPSLRLEALRRGLADRLLLQKLAACGGAAEAQAIARRMIPRALGEARGTASWPEDEPTWERARNEVLDALVRRCSHG